MSMSIDLNHYDGWIKNLIKGLGYEKLTEIQELVLPVLCSRRGATARHIDSLIVAPTGSGKTLAYSLPILQDLNRDKYGVYGLMILPTRELALQVEEQVRIFGKPIDVNVLALVGGFQRHQQLKDLKMRPNICVGTPGRIFDVLSNDEDAKKSFRNLKYLVLDEADTLLNFQHRSTLEGIMRHLPFANKGRKMIFCSATMNPETRHWRSLWLNQPPANIQFDTTGDGLAASVEEGDGNPWKISITNDNDGSGSDATALLSKVKDGIKFALECYDEMEVFEVGSELVPGVNDSDMRASSPNSLNHYMLFVNREDGSRQDLRLPYIVHILESHPLFKGTQVLDREAHDKARGVVYCSQGKKSKDHNEVQKRAIVQGILFVNTIEHAERLQVALEELKFECVALHGGLTQSDRVNNMKSFKSGRKLLLIATDVAARGLDVPNVSFVINFSTPREIDRYIHRTGRAGRAGKKGSALTIVTNEKDAANVEMIEEVIQMSSGNAEFEMTELDDFEEKKVTEKLNRIVQAETNAHIAQKNNDNNRSQFERSSKRQRYTVTEGNKLSAKKQKSEL